jgi:hypothetical protein
MLYQPIFRAMRRLLLEPSEKCGRRALPDGLGEGPPFFDGPVDLSAMVEMTRRRSRSYPLPGRESRRCP